MVPEVVFFDSPGKLRAWLGKHHAKVTELWIGFYRKNSGRPGITYTEALDEALCFGWIDGIRRKFDDISYTNRFTPRRLKSNWSEVNIARVKELIKLGRMKPSGLAAFEARRSRRSRPPDPRTDFDNLSASFTRKFMANQRAWSYFQSRPPGYRRLSIRWVMSAKKEETRLRRLAALIEDSSQKCLIAPLRRADKKEK